MAQQWSHFVCRQAARPDNHSAVASGNVENETRLGRSSHASGNQNLAVLRFDNTQFHSQAELSQWRENYLWLIADPDVCRVGSAAFFAADKMMRDH
jgi:hypothetical protein